jgi:hypothetical protein
VTGQIRYSESGIVFNRFTGVYTGTITLTNTDKTAITGPIQLVLTDLTPGLTLINAAGIFEGAPYITASGPLAADGSLTITLEFRKASSSLYVQYVPRFYSGSFGYSAPSAQTGSISLETSSNHPAGPVPHVVRRRVAQLGRRLAGRIDHLQRER